MLGVLLDETGRRPVLDSKDSFGAPYIHIKMLNDKARTDAYLKAIEEVIRPGDVVLDLGTGTGVFAATAARQGARHVYAIESSAIGSSAQGLFAANGLADRVTLVPGHSTQVSLPEPVDVLVSELIGNDPLGERIEISHGMLSVASSSRMRASFRTSCASLRRR